MGGSSQARETPWERVPLGHPLANVIGSLVRAGLVIDAFDEYPYVGWQMFPWMVQREDGCWELPGGAATLPLMFSLSARKDRS